MARRSRGVTLSVAIDAEAWKAANKADALKADPQLCIYAPLFEHAAQFWRDLLQLTENNWPMGPDHRAALDWVATQNMPRGA